MCYSPLAKVFALWWSSSSRPVICSRDNFPAAANTPACRIPPPRALRHRTAWDMKSLGPARMVPTGAPKPCYPPKHECDLKEFYFVLHIHRWSCSFEFDQKHTWIPSCYYLCVCLQTYLGEAHADGVGVLQDGGWRHPLGHSGVHHPGSIHVNGQTIFIC